MRRLLPHLMFLFILGSLLSVHLYVEAEEVKIGESCRDGRCVEAYVYEGEEDGEGSGDSGEGSGSGDGGGGASGGTAHHDAEDYPAGSPGSPEASGGGGGGGESGAGGGGGSEGAGGGGEAGSGGGEGGEGGGADDGFDTFSDNEGASGSGSEVADVTGDVGTPQIQNVPPAVIQEVINNVAPGLNINNQGGSEQNRGAYSFDNALRALPIGKGLTTSADLDAPMPASLADAQNGQVGNIARKTEGDPVNIRTGEFEYDLPLMHINDSVLGDIPISAHFSSGLLKGSPGPAGLGSTHTFSEMIVEQEREGQHRILYVSDNGSVMTFDLAPGNNSDTLSAMDNPALPLPPLCQRPSVGGPTIEEYEDLENPEEYRARGSPLTLEKDRKIVAYRLPGKPCGVTWKFQYTLKNPDGSRRIFDGIKQTPSNYRTVSKCQFRALEHRPGLVSTQPGLYRAREEWRRLEATLHEVPEPNALDVIQLGECREQESLGEELLRSHGRFIIPFGLTLISDRHPPTLGPDNESIGYQDFEPALTNYRPYYDNMGVRRGGEEAEALGQQYGMSSVGVSGWFVGGLEKNQNGTGRHFEIVREGRKVDGFSYNRTTEAYMLTWFSNGIVAPLRAMEDSKWGRLSFEYEVTYQPYHQFLHSVTQLHGYNSWNVEGGGAEVCEGVGEDQVCGEAADVAEPGTYGEHESFNTQTTHRVEQVTTFFPQAITLVVKKGEIPIAQLNYHFKLMRDENLEQQLAFGGPLQDLPLRNPNGYLPYRQVFYSVPLLQSIDIGGNVSVLHYVAPSSRGNCAIENDANAYGTFRSGIGAGEEIFVRHPPQVIRGRRYEETGWDIHRPVSGWDSCQNLPNGFSYLEGAPLHYNGPLLLSHVDYGTEGVPRTNLHYSITQDKQVRLTDVRINDQSYIHNDYYADGRVRSHSLGDTGSIQYQYNFTPREGAQQNEWTTVVTTRGGNQVHYSFNADGLLASKTGGEGTTTQFNYVPFDQNNPSLGAGRIQSIVYPNGQRLEYDYNVGQNIIERYLPRTIRQIGTDGSRVERTFSYEARFHNVSSVTYPAPGGASPTANIRYSYDWERAELNPCNADKPQGNLVRVDYPDGTYEATTHDKLGRVLEYRDQSGQIHRYEYRPFSDASLNCSEYGRLQ